MSRDDPQFKLRIPPALKAQIDQAAAENRRSLNAEIVARLEASFGSDGQAKLIASLVAQELLKMNEGKP